MCRWVWHNKVICYMVIIDTYSERYAQIHYMKQYKHVTWWSITRLHSKRYKFRMGRILEFPARGTTTTSLILKYKPGDGTEFRWAQHSSPFYKEKSGEYINYINMQREISLGDNTLKKRMSVWWIPDKPEQMYVFNDICASWRIQRRYMGRGTAGNRCYMKKDLTGRARSNKSTGHRKYIWSTKSHRQ